MAGPPVYEDGLFELSIDLSQNSLDSTFNKIFSQVFPLHSEIYLLIISQWVL